MRTRVYGWVVLGLAVTALPWDSTQQPRHADGKPGLAASTIGTQGGYPSWPTPIAMATVMPDAEIVAVDKLRALPRQPLALPAQRERGAVAPGGAARPAAASPAIAVREFAPGSRAHAEVIASSIASGEFHDMVSPLARLYLAYFSRPPDYEGFDYYIGERGRGEPLDAIAEEFAGSAEFNSRYGSLDNAAFVDLVLQNVFGDAGDAAQRAHWIAQLDAGSMTRGQVMLAFSESPAFRAATGNEVFVAMAYAETLGRAPGPADFSRWVAFLDAGNPRRAVIGRLLADRGGR